MRRCVVDVTGLSDSVAAAFSRSLLSRELLVVRL